MKFRQRQILLSLVLLCCGVVLLLHSRTPSSSDSVIELNSKAARASLLQNSAGDLAQIPKIIPAEETKIGNEEGLPKGQPPSDKNLTDVLKKKLPAEAPLSFVPRSSPTGECPKLLRPVNVAENQTFQKVDGGTSLYVFSAFLDAEEKLVRIIGLSAPRIQNAAFCLLWYDQSGDKELRVVSATVSPLPENHGRRYSASYIHCPLPSAPEDLSEIPYAVSVTATDCRQGPGNILPSNVLLVQRPRELERNFTVCITALNFRYSRAYELVEMIELNRMLGAESFTFYVNSVGENVDKVLRWYQDKGLVQLVQWDLPVEVDHWPPKKDKPPEVHYFAQLASHNDCLNRNRGHSRYLVYQDLDEFIIPKKTLNWTQMLATLEQGANAYIFRCIFFRKDWPPNEDNFTGKDIADKFKSITLSTMKREPQPFSHSQRAKYIINPKGIQIVGIHNIWRHRGLGKVVNVWDQDALMHHYRSWENPSDVNRAVKDTDMYRFKDDLLKKIQERWSQLPQVPLDIPLSHYGPV